MQMNRTIDFWRITVKGKMCIFGKSVNIMTLFSYQTPQLIIRIFGITEKPYKVS